MITWHTIQAQIIFMAAVVASPGIVPAGRQILAGFGAAYVSEPNITRGPSK